MLGGQMPEWQRQTGLVQESARQVNDLLKWQRTAGHQIWLVAGAEQKTPTFVSGVVSGVGPHYLHRQVQQGTLVSSLRYGASRPG